MSDINLCDCEEYLCSIRNKNGSKYKLSSKGRLYSYRSKRFIGHLDRGYVYISNLNFNSIHRMVYNYFIKDITNSKLEIDHIINIRNFNCVCNLRLCSRSGNMNNPLTKQKISENHKGMKGKKHTEESKQKMSESKKGKNNPMYGKIRIKKHKCYFCDSNYMNISHFINHHENGKCLFK